MWRWIKFESLHIAIKYPWSLYQNMKDHYILYGPNVLKPWLPTFSRGETVFGRFWKICLSLWLNPPYRHTIAILYCSLLCCFFHLKSFLNYEQRLFPLLLHHFLSYGFSSWTAAGHTQRRTGRGLNSFSGQGLVSKLLTLVCFAIVSLPCSFRSQGNKYPWCLTNNMRIWRATIQIVEVCYW